MIWRLVVASGAVLTALLAMPSAAPSAASTGSCDGVWVVVDATALGAGVTTRCAPSAGGTGLDVLAAAGYGVGMVQRNPAFVCRIDGRPTAEQDACVVIPPGDAYWSYWWADAGGSWRYASEGAATRRPGAGQVEGWRFGDGSGPPRVPPPASPPPPAAEEPAVEEPAAEEQTAERPAAEQPRPAPGDTSAGDASPGGNLAGGEADRSSPTAPVAGGTGTATAGSDGDAAEDDPATSGSQPSAGPEPDGDDATGVRRDEVDGDARAEAQTGSDAAVPTDAMSTLDADPVAAAASGSARPTGPILTGLLLLALTGAGLTLRARRAREAG